MHYELTDSFGLILFDVHKCNCCTISFFFFFFFFFLLHYILECNHFGMTLTSYLALLDAIYVNLPAKFLLKIQTVWVLSKVLASLVRNCFTKRPSGAPLHILSKLYYYVPLFVYPPPPSSFEAVFCFICDLRRVVVARYRMICLVLLT